MMTLSSSQVTAALAHAGLESSNLIVGVDYTKSNEWTGYKFTECLKQVLNYIELADFFFFLNRSKVIQWKKFASHRR